MVSYALNGNMMGWPLAPWPEKCPERGDSAKDCETCRHSDACAEQQAHGPGKGVQGILVFQGGYLRNSVRQYTAADQEHGRRTGDGQKPHEFG